MIPLFLYQRKLLSYPLLYISEYFEENRSDYYTLLNQVSNVGDWESWLRFFLKALTIESTKTQDTILRMLSLRDGLLKNEIRNLNSIHAINLLDILFAMPIISYASVKSRLGSISKQTVYTLLSKFVDLGILEDISGRQRKKVYVFKQLLEILK